MALFAVAVLGTVSTPSAVQLSFADAMLRIVPCTRCRPVD